jgi:tetratricopeptide (TPR) repeat protein
MGRRDALSRQAVELARRSGDPAVLAYSLEGRASIIGGRPGTDAEQTALATELLQLAERGGDRERVVQGHYLKFIAAIGVGDVSSAEAALAAATIVAQELRQPAQLWQVRAARAMLALAAGRLTEAEELIEQALALGEHAQRRIAIPTHTLQRYTLRDFQGRLAEIEPTIQMAVAEYSSQPVYRCALAHLHARLSHTRHAQRALDELAADDFTALPLDNEWLYATSLLAEACSLLHHAGGASVLYRMLSPYDGYNAVDTPDAIRGSVSRYLGQLAAVTARWNEAVTHFEDALAMNARMGFLPWLSHTRHDYARVLLRRKARGDTERAAELIGEAITAYRELGMDIWAAKAAELQRSPQADPPARE